MGTREAFGSPRAPPLEQIQRTPNNAGVSRGVRLSKAERRELEARLRADEAALNTRIEEIWAELDSMEGIELHDATQEGRVP